MSEPKPATPKPGEKPKTTEKSDLRLALEDPVAAKDALKLSSRLTSFMANPLALLKKPEEAVQVPLDAGKLADKELAQRGATKMGGKTIDGVSKEVKKIIPGADQLVDQAASLTKDGMKGVMDLMNSTGIAKMVADVAKGFDKNMKLTEASPLGTLVESLKGSTKVASVDPKAPPAAPSKGGQAL